VPFVCSWAFLPAFYCSFFSPVTSAKRSPTILIRSIRISTLGKEKLCHGFVVLVHGNVQGRLAAVFHPVVDQVRIAFKKLHHLEDVAVQCRIMDFAQALLPFSASAVIV